MFDAIVLTISSYSPAEAKEEDQDAESSQAAQPVKIYDIVKGVPSKLPPHRGVEGYVDEFIAIGQTDPPTIPVSALYPDGNFPVGEEQPYKDFVTAQVTSDEARYNERLHSNLANVLREASEVHRQVGFICMDSIDSYSSSFCFCFRSVVMPNQLLNQVLNLSICANLSKRRIAN